MSLGAFLTTDTPGLTEKEKQRIESEFYPRHRSIQVIRSTILLLSLVSEIEQFFNFGVAPTVVDLWTTIVNSGVPEGREIYDRRYTQFWPVIR
jgi:hypothetical protein